MKKSDKIALIAGIGGVVSGLASAYFWESASWIAHVVVGVVVAVGLDQGIKQQVTLDKAVDN
ncbi:hypothetical protein [Bordetella petrii]|uniref:hypothetical protein n=1 Tax=Bordetella petrii TaxID=94624 RepID=UPI0002D2ECB5|nr:hypothetical protein [Bordetella petrii]